jgi:hypothetical protein
MLKALIIFLFVIIVLAVVALQFGISYLIFWALLKAGAPRYMALLCGIAYFCISGWVANIKK